MSQQPKERHEEPFVIVEGPMAPDMSTTASLHRLTVFSFVPISIGSIYFIYRAAGIVLVSPAATWMQLLTYFAFLCVELSFAGEMYAAWIRAKC